MTFNDSNSTQTWKRPWTMEEIVVASQCWSLAADSGVCEFLKGFSTDLLNEVSQLSNNVSELSIEATRTNVMIQNAFNDFCMLANNQFMENLVEDTSSIPISGEQAVIDNGETASNKEDKMAQLVPLVIDSLRMGMQVLETQFETYEERRGSCVSPGGGTEDSSQQLDGGQSEPVWQPRDPYEHRHLPHLIGTTAFVDDDTLGIGQLDDEDDDEEEDDDDDKEEEPPSHRRADSLSSLSGSESGGEESVRARQPSHQNPPQKQQRSQFANSRSSSSSSIDLFGTDKKSGPTRLDSDDDFSAGDASVSTQHSQQQPQQQRALSVSEALQAQLKVRLGISSAAPPNSSVVTADNDGDDGEESHHSNEVSVSQSNNNNHNKLANITRSIISKPATDSDDEDDLFADNPKTKSSGVISKLASSQMPVSSVTPLSTGPSTTTAAPTAIPRVTKPAPASHFSSDSDGDDLFNPRPISTQVKPPLQQLQSQSQPQSQSPSSGPKQQIPIKKQSSKLFDSDSDDGDDLFQPAVSKPNPVEPKSDNKPQPTLSLLNPPKMQPEEKTEPKLKVDTKPKSYLEIIADDDDEDDIFKLVLPKSDKPTEIKNTSKNPPKTQEVPSIDPLGAVNASDSKSIIPSKAVIEDKYDLFEEPAKPVKVMDEGNNVEASKSGEKINEPVTNIPRNIFSEDSDDGDLISSKDTKKPEPVSVTISNKDDPAKNNSAGPVLFPTSPQTSKRSGSEVEGMEKSKLEDEMNDKVPISLERPSLVKRPPGAVQTIGTPMLAELKTKQRKSLLLDSDDDSVSTDDQSVVKSDFKDKLSSALSGIGSFPVPVFPTAPVVSKSGLETEKEISFEAPAEEVRQLTLLTKTRARNIPRRRPTVKKTEEETSGDHPFVESTEITNSIPSLPSVSPSPPALDKQTSQDLPKKSLIDLINIIRSKKQRDKVERDNTDLVNSTKKSIYNLIKCKCNCRCGTHLTTCFQIMVEEEDNCGTSDKFTISSHNQVFENGISNNKLVQTKSVVHLLKKNTDVNRAHREKDLVKHVISRPCTRISDQVEHPSSKLPFKHNMETSAIQENEIPKKNPLIFLSKVLPDKVQISPNKFYNHSIKLNVLLNELENNLIPTVLKNEMQQQPNLEQSKMFLGKAFKKKKYDVENRRRIERRLIRSRYENPKNHIFFIRKSIRAEINRIIKAKKNRNKIPSKCNKHSPMSGKAQRTLTKRPLKQLFKNKDSTLIFKFDSPNSLNKLLTESYSKILKTILSSIIYFLIKIENSCGTAPDYLIHPTDYFYAEKVITQKIYFQGVIKNLNEHLCDHNKLISPARLQSVSLNSFDTRDFHRRSIKIRKINIYSTISCCFHSNFKMEDINSDELLKILDNLQLVSLMNSDEDSPTQQSKLCDNLLNQTESNTGVWENEYQSNKSSRHRLVVTPISLYPKRLKNNEFVHFSQIHKLKSKTKCSRSFYNSSQLLMQIWSYQEPANHVALTSSINLEYPVVMKQFRLSKRKTLNDSHNQIKNSNTNQDRLETSHGNVSWKDEFANAFQFICRQIKFPYSALKSISLDLSNTFTVRDSNTNHVDESLYHSVYIHSRCVSPLEEELSKRNLEKRMGLPVTHFTTIDDETDSSLSLCQLDILSRTSSLLCDISVNVLLISRSFKSVCLMSLFSRAIMYNCLSTWDRSDTRTRHTSSVDDPITELFVELVLQSPSTDHTAPQL